MPVSLPGGEGCGAEQLALAADQLLQQFLSALHRAQLPAQLRNNYVNSVGQPFLWSVKVLVKQDKLLADCT